ncbi:MAG TPA: fibronectin type III-like domain-contianing protein, partial [Ktedonobacteraceae bacterium]|nr:fibronectin type III-like domain-contianing protein [Ktedonobacteraceae bacterium]
INKTEMNVGETLEVTVTVHNKGERAGKEIIQLYIQPLTSQFLRPNKELKAFAKVSLQPGESKDVRMALKESDFQIYNDERQTWLTDGGEYNILIGSSSESIVLRERLTVHEDPRSLASQFNRLSPVKQFLQYPKTRELLANTFAGTPRASLFLNEEEEMFTSMPIAKMVVLGVLTDEKVNKLIEQANQMTSK